MGGGRHAFAQQHHPHVAIGVGLRVRLGQTAHDHVQLGLRLRQGRARLEPAADPKALVGARWARAAEVERLHDLGLGIGVPLRRRHDADHRRRLAVDLDRAAHEPHVTCVALLPEPFAEHDRARRSG